MGLGQYFPPHLISMFGLDVIEEVLQSCVGVGVAVGKEDLVIRVFEVVAKSKSVVIFLFVVVDRVGSVLDVVSSAFPALLAFN